MKLTWKAEFAKEKREHPSFTSKQIFQIVKDHHRGEKHR
jgi:hypothetical protein